MQKNYNYQCVQYYCGYGETLFYGGKPGRSGLVFSGMPSGGDSCGDCGAGGIKTFKDAGGAEKAAD